MLKTTYFCILYVVVFKCFRHQVSLKIVRNNNKIQPELSKPVTLRIFFQDDRILNYLFFGVRVCDAMYN